jgi:succinate dehydrogenase / fumarate reductase membrane anchor subunit
MVKQAPVGAHYGLRDWLAQRITAIVMIFYSAYMLALLLWCPPHTHAGWKALFSGMFIRPLTAVLLVALLYHAWVGVRDIWMDYVKNAGVRLALQTATLLILVFYAAWAATILWG